MVQINFARREIEFKVCYVGPARSGKTTNLQQIHDRAPRDRVGDLNIDSTETDPTVSHEYLRLDLGSISGMSTTLHLYAGPGQARCRQVRQVLLRDVDGVVFVADSQRPMLEENRESLDELLRNLEDNGSSVDEIDLVFQWNKRDLTECELLTPEELDAALNAWGFAAFQTETANGTGVFDTLKSLTVLMVKGLYRGQTGEDRGAPRDDEISDPSPTRLVGGCDQRDLETREIESVDMPPTEPPPPTNADPAPPAAPANQPDPAPPSEQEDISDETLGKMLGVEQEPDPPPEGERPPRPCRLDADVSNGTLDRLLALGEESETGNDGHTEATDVPTGDGELTTRIENRRVAPADGEGSEKALPRPQPGDLLKGYRILQRLGDGGFGLVFEAKHVELNRRVALKLMHPHLARNTAYVDRFLGEAQAMASMDHRNICKLLDFGRIKGHGPYFTMDFVKGQTLQAAIDSDEMSPIRTAEVLEKVSRAIHYAHRRGVIHRDLKPANIMLDTSGEPKVLDFGLAKAGKVAAGEEADGPKSSVYARQQISDHGDVMGTLPYMPPEQALGKIDKIDARSDIWAVGAVLYCCLTGSSPFSGNTRHETIDRIVNDPPEDPSAGNTLVPPDLSKICLKCLEKDPSKRYQTAEELAEDLQRFLRGEPVAANPAGLFMRIAKSYARNSNAWFVSLPLLAVSALFAINASGLIIFALGGAVLVAVMEWRLAERSRDAATRAKDLVEWERDRAKRRSYCYEIQRVTKLCAAQRYEEARAALASLPGELRHWEWQHLMALARDRYLPVHPECELGPLAITFNSEGTLLVVRDTGDHVEIVDGTSGELVTTTPIPSGSHDMVAFAPDGSGLAWTTGQSRLDIWDVGGQRPTRNLLANACLTGVMAFSGDGRYLAMMTGDAIHLWDGGDDEAPAATTYTSNAPRTAAIAAASSGQWGLAAAAEGGWIHEFGPGASSLRTLFRTNIGDIAAIAISPDGARAAVGGMTGAIEVWEISDARRLGTIREHTGAVSALTFSPDGRTLASASADGYVAVWDALGGVPLWRFAWFPSHGAKLVFSGDGCSLAALQRNRPPSAWDVAPVALTRYPSRTTACRCPRLTPGGEVFCGFVHIEPEIHPDANVRRKEVATMSLDADEIRRRVQTMQGKKEKHDRKAEELGPARPPLSFAQSGEAAILVGETDSDPVEIARTKDVASVDISPGARLLAIGYRDGTVCLLDPAEPKKKSVFRVDSGEIHRIVFSPTGNAFATATMNGAVRLWRRPGDADGAWAHDLLIDGPADSASIQALAFSRDGNRLAVSMRGGVGVWDITEAPTRAATKLTTLRGHSDQAQCIAFSPDRTHLAAGCWDGGIHVWKLATGAGMAPITGHQGVIWDVTFSPDGKRLATASSDGTVGVWCVREGRELITLDIPKDSPTVLRFSSDARHLLALTDAAMARRWIGERRARPRLPRAATTHVSARVLRDSAERPRYQSAREPWAAGGASRPHQPSAPGAGSRSPRSFRVAESHERRTSRRPPQAPLAQLAMTLVKRGLISRLDMDLAHRRSHGGRELLLELLIADYGVAEPALAAALAEILGHEYIEFDADRAIDRRIVGELDKERATKLLGCPLEHMPDAGEETVLHVVVRDPLNSVTLHGIEAATAGRIGKISVATKETVLSYVEKAFGGDSNGGSESRDE